MLSIKLFPAEYGDCIMLSIGKHHQYNILIDGGLSKTYQKYIKSEIQHIKEMRQKIGLIVCTHMDNDHICGLIQVLKEADSDFIENIWYNGFLQIVDSRFYSQKENNFTDRDNKILDRELTPLKKINDNYPKYILTLDDDLDADFDGIKKINVLDWLLDEK